MPENLTPWTDPELEARVVALVLGEASDFERDQLREIIAGNAELAAFQKRMDAIHGLLLESCGRNPETGTESTNSWQLPDPQRQPLLDVLSTASAPKPSPAPKRRVRLLVRPAFWWSAAACFVIAAIAALSIPTGDMVMHCKSPDGRGNWGMAVPQSTAVATSTPSAPPPPPAEEPVPAAAAPAKPAGSAGEQLAFADKNLSDNALIVSNTGSVRGSGTIGALSGNVSMVGGNEVIVRLEPEPKPATSPAPAAATPQAIQFGRTLNRSAGNATLDLNGTNTYTGGVTVNSGTAIGSGGIVKSGAGTLTMNGGAFTSSGVVSGQAAPSTVQLRIDGNDKTKDKVVRSDELAIVPRSGVGIYSYSSAPSPIAGKSETRALPDLTGYISKGEKKEEKSAGEAIPQGSPKDSGRTDNSKMVVAPEPINGPSQVSAYGGGSFFDNSRASHGRGGIIGGEVALATSIAQQDEKSELVKQGKRLLSEPKDPGIDSPTAIREKIKTRKGEVLRGSEIMADIPVLGDVPIRSRSLGELLKKEAKKEPGPGADGTASSLGKNSLNQKLKQIIIPKIEFKDTPVDVALEQLRQKARESDDLEADPAKRGVNIVVGNPSTDSDAAKSGEKKPTVTLNLSNVPLEEALRYTTEQAKLKYKADPNALVVVPAGEAGGELYTQVVRVPPSFLSSSSSSELSAGDPFSDLGEKENKPAIQQRKTAREILESVGVTFPPGSSATYDPTTSQLVIRNTQSNLDLVEAYVEAEKEATPETEKHPVVETAQPQPRPEPESIPEIATSTEPFSTFSLHVSDVSFKLAQASLAEGKWPDPSRIRIEEFVNAFDYGDPSPAGSEPVACALEQSIHPFQQARNLLRISLRTASAGRASSTPLRLTLLLDSSGSMERADRRETLQAAISQLAGQLKAEDRVTLVTFARQPRLQADQLPGDQAKTLPQIIANTPSEGGTNLEAALKLATEKAREHFQANAQNRIVLLTDGAANLGDANPERLSQAVEAMRRQGIAFDTAGIGADGLNDTVLEALSRKGDGRYYLLDSPDDAGANFAAQLAGAFRPAAKNVKVQVWFNPDRVRRYRLLGFEEHRLEKEDFRNDSVDAAELAAAEAGVAMYQFEPLPEGVGDIGYVSVRFQDTASGQMIERRWPISYEANPQPFEKASAGIRLAASAAFLAAKLGDDPLASRIDLSVLDHAAANEDLRTLIHQTRNLSTTR